MCVYHYVIYGGFKGWEKKDKENKVHREPPSINEEALLARFYTSQIILNQDPGLG